MDALVELIKQIGIFMIAAQAVIHFAPDIKYAKYMKLIVGIMILLQFLPPVYRIVGGMEEDWGAGLPGMEQGMHGGMQNDMQIAGFPEAYADSYPVADTVVRSMEQEIKSKLNNILLSDNLSQSYVVTGVMVRLEAARGHDGNAPEYLLDKVRVVVREHAEYRAGTAGAEHESGTGSTDDVGGTGKIEKVQIDKIGITADGFEEENDMPSAYGGETTADSLRKRFCNGLGMDERYMEVRVYGALKEAVE